jgi:hypothetical protein
MGDKLAFVFEYRVLLAKQRDLQIPLTPNEEARLQQLKQQLPDRVPSVDERDAFTVVVSPLPAQFVAAARFGSGTLCNISALGLAITTVEEPPALGQRLILHVQDAQTGTEYTFPCRVLSRIVKGSMSMGVRFEGVPSQTQVGARTGSVWRSDIFSSEEAPPQPSVRPSRSTRP